MHFSRVVDFLLVCLKSCTYSIKHTVLNLATNGCIYCSIACLLIGPKIRPNCSLYSVTPIKKKHKMEAKLLGLMGQ